MEQAIQAALKAFISEATLTNLCLASGVALLFWMLKEERAARREDAKAVTSALSQSHEALTKLSEVLTELRITVAGMQR